MSVERSLFERLAESPGPMAHLPNNGAAYHSGEQIITHLNRVLGPAGWSFHILDTGEESDSDECWVFGQITAIIDGITVVKQDYGSQAFKRRRDTGKFIAKWDDKKAATTDALKRCARLLGVGLDAWANERAPSWRPEDQPEGNAPSPATGSAPKQTPSSVGGGSSTATDSNDQEALYCEECNEPLTETRFKDGQIWSAAQLASFGKRKHSRILDMKCYREANNAKRRAEEALQQAPF
jgi:hypothetical protein